jgi:hypothetical protein
VLVGSGPKSFFRIGQAGLQGIWPIPIPFVTPITRHGDHAAKIRSLGCVFYEIGALKYAFFDKHEINLVLKLTNLNEDSPNLAKDHILHGLIEK